MGFELREHTADVAVEACGDSLGETFGAVADGLTAAMCDGVPEAGERHEVRVEAESAEALLFDYLDELIYRRDADLVLPVDHEASVEDERETWTLVGSFGAVPLAEVEAREVKAVTYSEMRLAETSDGWEAYVVFDV
jgi:SHS2 domain-containing protein